MHCTENDIRPSKERCWGQKNGTLLEQAVQKETQFMETLALHSTSHSDNLFLSYISLCKANTIPLVRASLEGNLSLASLFF